MKNFVSVIITVFNDTRIQTTLNSLYYQTYPYHQYEVIVIDDKSDLDIHKICDFFPNVRYLRLEKNSGSYAARNRGIKEAKGNILAFTDSDCILEKDWIEQGLKALQPETLGIVGGHIQLFGKGKFRLDEYLDSVLHLRQDIWTRKRNFAATGNAFIKKEVFDNVGLFREDLRSMGDFEFGNRAFLRGWKIEYCRDAIAHHPARQWREIVEKVSRCNLGRFQINSPNIIFIFKQINITNVNFKDIRKDRNIKGFVRKIKFVFMIYYLNLLTAIQAFHFMLKSQRH